MSETSLTPSSLYQALAVEMGQSRGEGLACLGPELDLNRPVLARLERLDLGFPLADQT